MDSSAIQMVNENDMDMFNASHLISGHQRPSLDCNDRDSASSSCIATYFSCFKDSLAEKVDLGGQSLPNERPLAYASSSKIGRFEIISWAEYLGPLLQPRPTAWPDHLLLGSKDFQIKIFIAPPASWGSLHRLCWRQSRGLLGLGSNLQFERLFVKYS